MSTIFDYQKWEEIARRATSGDQVWDILASWKAECNALQKEIDELMDEHIGDVKCLCDFEYSIVPKIEEERDALQKERDIYIAENVELKELCESKQRMVEYAYEERNALQRKLDIAVEALKDIADDRLQYVDFTREYRISAKIALKQLEEHE